MANRVRPIEESQKYIIGWICAPLNESQIAHLMLDCREQSDCSELERKRNAQMSARTTSKNDAHFEPSEKRHPDSPTIQRPNTIANASDEDSFVNSFCDNSKSKASKNNARGSGRAEENFTVFWNLRPKIFSDTIRAKFKERDSTTSRPGIQEECREMEEKQIRKKGRVLPSGCNDPHEYCQMDSSPSFIEQTSDNQTTVRDMQLYKDSAWPVSEYGAISKDEKIRTGESVLHSAIISSYESLVLLILASASAAVATSWNSKNNNATIESGNSARAQREFILPTMNPGLTEFVLALSAYSFSVTVYAQRRRDNYWQDHVVLLALLASTLSGLSLGYDLQTTILSIVSWAVIAALILSSVCHEAVRRSRRIPS